MGTAAVRREMPTVIGANQVVAIHMALAELNLSMGAAVLQRLNRSLSVSKQHDGLVP